jgi:hypothetical protein
LKSSTPPQLLTLKQCFPVCKNSSSVAASYCRQTEAEFHPLTSKVAAGALGRQPVSSLLRPRRSSMKPSNISSPLENLVPSSKVCCLVRGGALVWFHGLSLD